MGMKDYLDNNGVRYLWTKIKNIFVQKESGKGLSTNDFTTAYKNKLDGIASGANNYSLPTATSTRLGGIKVGSGLSITGGGVLSASGGISVSTQSVRLGKNSTVTLSEVAKLAFISSNYDTVPIALVPGGNYKYLETYDGAGMQRLSLKTTLYADGVTLKSTCNYDARAISCTVIILS